ncbi:MAG: hypothetical protein COA57_15325 [Flavobacteriales bacterium]|nr:T9SS type A sorting domain-containing protein [Bacteroidales bacterium AH-315-I05]PCJ79815.1 MAG: hypothetical protein COA57_15325 [Flavobacteriales bacterium]
MMAGPLFCQDVLVVLGDLDIKSSASLYVNGNVLGSGSGQITNNGNLYVQEHTAGGSENWVNNAAVNFLDGAGAVVFNSNDLQLINGTQKTSFYNLTIDNSGLGVRMGQNIDVLNNLSMTNGDLDLQNSVLDLSTSGIIVSESEVNRIKVGDVMANTGIIKCTKTIDNVTNNNPANIGVEITTNQNLGLIDIVRGHQRQAGTGASSANYGIARHIDIPGIGELDGTNINVELHYWEAELDPTDHPSEANLMKFHKITESATIKWTSLTGTINAGSNIATPAINPYSSYVYGAAYPSITFNDRFTLSSDITPLPVELLYFKALWVGGDYSKVKLEWETATEINNDFFVVERSLDAQNFTPVITVKGNGNSNDIINYIEYDSDPFKKEGSFYRLKQVDFDGSFKYSDITYIYPPANIIAIISIYPNPTDKELTLEINTLQGDEIHLSVVDNMGRKVIHKKSYIYEGGNILKIDVSNLSSASYQLVISTESDLYKTQKEFIKK